MDNYYTTILPILRIFQLFGFAPYRIAMATSSPTSIHRAPILTVQTALMLIVICGHFIYMLYVLLFLKINRTASAFVVLVWMLGPVILNTLIFVQAWLSSGHQQTLLLQLAEIDALARTHLPSQQPYRQTGRQRMRKVCRTLVVVMLAMPLFWSIWYVMSARKIFFKHMLVPPVFMSVRLLQILFFLDLLVEHLQMICDRLRAIERQSNRQWKLIVIARVNRGEQPPTTGNQLRMLRHIYGKVWRATLQFNDHFGASILLLWLYYWLDIFTCVYFIFVIWVGIYKQSMILCLLCIPSVINTALLTRSTVRCMQTATDIQIELSRLRHENGCHSEIKLFSLQTMHEPITIDANGFFCVTHAIIGSFASGIASFMLLYGQFEIRDKFAD